MSNPEEHKQPDAPKSETHLAYEKELQEKNDLIAFSETSAGRQIIESTRARAEAAIFAIISEYREAPHPVLLAQIALLEANLSVLGLLAGAKGKAETIKQLIESLKV